MLKSTHSFWPSAYSVFPAIMSLSDDSASPFFISSDRAEDEGADGNAPRGKAGTIDSSPET